MRKAIKNAILIIIYIGIILIETKVYGASTGTVNSSSTRIRREASTDSDVIVLVSNGEEVQILSQEGEWYEVEYESDGITYTGYIRSDLLDVEENSENTNSSENENQAENTENENQNENTENENTENNNQNQEEESSETSSQEENTEANNENQVEENSSEENTNSENSTEVSDTPNTTTPTEQNNMFQENDVITITENIDVKILPLINSSNIENIKENTEITVIEIIGNWCHIEADEQSGWVSKTILTNVMQPEEEQNSEENQDNEENNQDNSDENTSADNEDSQGQEKQTLYVNTQTLNLREQPENDAEILRQLPLNAEVTLEEEVDGTWSRVTASGTIGYVATQYLSDRETASTTSRGSDEVREDTEKSENTNNSENEETQETKNEETNKEETKTEDNTEENLADSSSENQSVTGADIVSYAKQYLGYKYVSGGTSPSTGFDCSGFTQYVYKHFGYSISRTSSAQRSDGIEVSKSNLQQGDIVCFTGHVGIYIGGNQFIHASNPSDGVKITSLSTSYYTKRYITARRILD